MSHTKKKMFTSKKTTLLQVDELVGEFSKCRMTNSVTKYKIFFFWLKRQKIKKRERPTLSWTIPCSGAGANALLQPPAAGFYRGRYYQSPRKEKKNNASVRPSLSLSPKHNKFAHIGRGFFTRLPPSVLLPTAQIWSYVCVCLCGE